MASPIELSATARQQHGSSAANRLRREQGLVPAVVYGGGQQPQSVNIEHRLLMHALEHESTFSQILKLTIDGKLEQVVLKEVQRHPSRPRLLHADFLRVSAKEKITMLVPIHYEGEALSPGFKSGGLASRLITEVEVSCLPANLPEYLAVDVSALKSGDSLHLSDLTLPKGVELTAHIDGEHNQPIFSIHAPRGTAADNAEDAQAAEAKAVEEKGSAA